MHSYEKFLHFALDVITVHNFANGELVRAAKAGPSRGLLTCADRPGPDRTEATPTVLDLRGATSPGDHI